MRNVYVLISLLMLGCSSAQPLIPVQGDWPNYRGAGHDNFTPAQGIEVSLKDAEDRVVWRKDIGLGYSVVATANGHAYTAGWRDGRTSLICFDPDTGENIWTFEYEIEQYDVRPEWPKSNEGGPVTTPAIADGRVYHSTRDGRLFCLDARSGELDWQHELTEVFGVDEPRWGYAASPLVMDGVIYLDVGRVVALRATDGEVLWATQESYDPSYATVTPFTFNGKHYLAAWPLDGLVIVEREAGGVVAHHPWQSNQPCHAASPVVFDNDKVFISSGFNSGGAVLRFTGDALDLVWEHKDMCNTMATSLYHQGHLYGFDHQVLRCVNAQTGEVKWSMRGLGKGSLTAVGDHMVILAENGLLLSAKMDPDQAPLMASAQSSVKLIDETAKIWSAPVIAQRRLYARGPLGSLVCLDLSKQ
ncbi:MAG: PQQ-binding-like beta-propeller repeat protein [Planctomycetota bacterium]